MWGNIWQIILTAFVTTVGTFVVTNYTLTRSAANDATIRREELERHARYLAIRVVCKLDPFVSECCDVVQDTGMPDPEGVTTPRIDDPNLALPEDVDWKTIPPDLMYRILGFPNDVDVAHQSIHFVGNEIASPPDYEEYFDERTLQFGRLGLTALALADEIRRAYSIPPRDYGNWSPKDVLNKAVAETDKAQRERRAEILDLMDDAPQIAIAKQAD